MAIRFSALLLGSLALHGCAGDKCDDSDCAEALGCEPDPPGTEDCENGEDDDGVDQLRREVNELRNALREIQKHLEKRR